LLHLRKSSSGLGALVALAAVYSKAAAAASGGRLSTTSKYFNDASPSSITRQTGALMRFSSPPIAASFLS
jgi:hypothetical protein